MIFIRLLSKLPLSILYYLSEVVYIFLFYLTAYRKKVVKENLRNSFPDKNTDEIDQIAKKFYRHLAQIIVEIIKTPTIEFEEIKQRVDASGMEKIIEEINNGSSPIVLTSHQGNWEWILAYCGISVSHPIDAVYQKIKNRGINKFFLDLRSRFGAYPIEKRSLVKEVVKRKNILRYIAIISDQTPRFVDKAYWKTFLNQDTPFFEGPFKIAKMMQLPVYYISMHRLKTGRYKLTMKLLGRPPYTSDNQLIDKYITQLEEDIIAQPETWLWSHKRWKYKKS
ncbi:MAG: lysophospholipid acyltransferase family protein [Cyclobacteriaceae bacterium]|nr:lysophospholipid acyltransferase family protein [Cyclobacteriaceae bacterium]